MQAHPGYDAARRRAAVLDRAGRGRIAVAGSDRRSYLHAMLTNDISALQPGAGCYAAFLTPQGRMIADMRVLELGDLVLLDLPAAETPEVLRKLDAFVFGEDVRLGDLTDAFGCVSVAGPDAARIVRAVLSSGAASPASVPSAAALGDWPEFRNARLSFRGETVVLVSSRDFGIPGFDLVIERPHVPALAGAFSAAGVERLSEEAAHALRIEAGRPLFGADMNAETIPLEAGIEARAISFTKGCYPGQEVVIRIVHRGHGRVARRLMGLVLAGDTVPAPGEMLRSAGADAGRITSAAWSPLVGAAIALAYLQRAFAEAGAEVVVEHEGDALSARVVSLPFAARSPSDDRQTDSWT